MISLWSLDDHRLISWRLGRSLFTIDDGFKSGFPSLPRGLVIGECSDPNADLRTPLFPNPMTSTAGRLMRFGQLTPSQYLGRLERVNQCDYVWDEFVAIARLRLMIRWICEHPGIRILLLGRKVQRVWGIGSNDGFGDGFGYERWMDVPVAFAPHPSAHNRVYRDRKAQIRLGRRLRWVAGLGTENMR